MPIIKYKLMFLVSVLVLATNASAFREPDVSELRDKVFRHSALSVNQVYLPASQVVGELYNQQLAALQTLSVDAQSAYIDTRSGRFGTLMPAQPLLPGSGKGNSMSWQNEALNQVAPNSEQLKQLAWDAFIGYLSTHKNALNIDVTELQNPGTVTVLRGGDLIQINAQRIVNGIAVRNSFVTAVINHGNLTLFGTRNWSDMIATKTPSIDADEAQNSVEFHLDTFASKAHWGKTSMFYLPVADMSKPYRLVWSLSAKFDHDELAEWEALVDAENGELLVFDDTSNYASTREVIGGQFPVSNDGVAPDGVEVTSPMPFANVVIGGETYYTDTGGNIMACLDGDMTTTLEGKFLTMNDSCGATSETSAGPILDLGSGPGTDCAVPGGASAGNTHASRSGFYEINRMIEIAQSHLPENEWLRNPVPSLMNINDSCNATGGPGGFRFFTSGSGCSNTGEIAGVFVHEWGHGMDGSDANPTISSPSEGTPDIYASLRLNDSCIGRNFRPNSNCTGFGDACTQCTGVRDVDWGKRASGTPHDIAWVDANCGIGPSPCGGIVHCEGTLAGETVWDLWNRDLPGAPYNMNSDTARELATALTFAGAGPVGDWYSCNDGTGVGDGCNADGGYLNYLAADDDDGDLSNGTPHMSAIFASFDRHGIACPTPVVQDNGCANLPATAPSVVASAVDRGIDLSWNAVADATRYQVYRTEGVFACDFGKVLIGETTDLTFQDRALANGRDYSYTVIPMGTGAMCYGTSSSCTTAAPVAGANLGLDQMSAMLTINNGDGDNYLDNCESATLDVGVANLGTGNLDGVVISSVESISHPSINGSIDINPASVSGLAECSIASSGFSFVADSLSYNEVIEFNVCVTSDEMSPAEQCGVVTIENTESDDVFNASKTFSFEEDFEGWSVNRGTFNRSSGSADDGTFALRSSSFLNGQCDKIYSPIMKFSATSTVSMATNYDIEDFSGGIWWDRAHVSILDEGAESLITPDGGRLYNAGIFPEYSGCNNDVEGWAGSATSWANSTWSDTVISGFAGNPSQLTITYGTDGAVVERGFWVDTVTVTDVILQKADEQSNTFCLDDLIFADGFEEIKD